jgi:hypothetical protein
MDTPRKAGRPKGSLNKVKVLAVEPVSVTPEPAPATPEPAPVVAPTPLVTPTPTHPPQQRLSHPSRKSLIHRPNPLPRGNGRKNRPSARSDRGLLVLLPRIPNLPTRSVANPSVNRPSPLVRASIILQSMMPYTPSLVSKSLLT